MLTVIRGDTLELLIKRSDYFGNPLTGDTSKLRSQIRTAKGELMATFEITESEVLGSYNFLVPASITVNFPLGNLFFDIEYNDGETITSSEVIQIKVIGDVTKDE